MWEQLLISLLPGLFQIAFGNNTSFSKINLKDAFSNPQNLSNLIGLFGQGYQTALNYQNQQQNLDWQRQFAMQQFNYNSILNDRSFFHSLPVSQISKLISAGLSPDLAYGQLTGMDYGNPATVSMPNASASNFAGLENANLLENTKKITNENKQLNELTKGIEFDNVEKEFNSILHEIFKQSVNNNRDSLEYGIQHKIETFFNESYSNNKKSAISTQFITELYKELVYEDNGVEFPTDKLKELSLLFIDNEIKGFNIENITKSLAYFNSKSRYNDREFWYASEKLTQDCINEVNKLAKNNAEIEKNFLSGEITKETFFKALLLVFSRGVGGITINRKDTDIHNETTNDVNYENNYEKYFDNRGRKN